MEEYPTRHVIRGKGLRRTAVRHYILYGGGGLVGQAYTVWSLGTARRRPDGRPHTEIAARGYMRDFVLCVLVCSGG